MLLGEKMLEGNGIRMQFSCYKDNIKNHQDFKRYPPPPFWKFFRKLPTHFTLLCKNIFTINLYISHHSAKSFSIRTAQGAQLGFRGQWIVYWNLRTIWFLLVLCHLFRFRKCVKCLIVLTTWMDPKTQAN